MTENVEQTILGLPWSEVKLGFSALGVITAIVVGIFLICYGFWKFLDWAALTHRNFTKWWKIHKLYKIGKVTHVKLSHYISFNLVDPNHYPLDVEKVRKAVLDGNSGIFFNLWEYRKFKKYCKNATKKKNQAEVAKELEAVNNKISDYIKEQFEKNQRAIQKNINQMQKVIDSMEQKRTSA